MKILIKNTFVYGYGDADILIADGIITKIEKHISPLDFLLNIIKYEVAKNPTGKALYTF